MEDISSDNSKQGLYKPDSAKLWLSVRELQEELGIGKGLAYRLIQLWSIPHVCLGTLIKVHRSDLEKAFWERGG